MPSIRLDFIAFFGFPLDKLPRLLNEINRQLQSHGLMMQKTKGAIVEATWVKKGKKSHYGYRAYGVVDDEGYLLGSHPAPANQSEMNHFILALEAAHINAVTAEPVLADKGSASQAHRDDLKSKKIKCGIMLKAVRNKPLRRRQKLDNQAISNVRYRMEQFFGTLKRKFDFRRARYIGVLKVNSQMLLKGICANLLKAANKIQIDWSVVGVNPSKIRKMA